MKTIGESIAHFRRSAEMTQEGLAEKMNVSAQAVSKWENDLSYPDIDCIKKLAALFGVSVDTLLDCDKPVVETKSGTPESISKRIVNINVTVADVTRVSVNLPLNSIESVLSSVGGLPECLMKLKVKAPEIEELINNVLETARNGVVGTVLDVETEDNDEKIHVVIKVLDYEG